MIPSPSPFRHRSRKGRSHCELCRCILPYGKQSAESHEAGSRHRRNLERSMTPLCDGDQYCSVCDVNLFRFEQFLPKGYSPYGNKIFDRRCVLSAEDLARHESGRKHQANLESRKFRCRLERETRKLEAIMVEVLTICNTNGLSDDLTQDILRRAGHECSLVELASVEST